MVVIPSRMGRLNKRALLVRLQRLGTASRAGLAKSLGLSQPTAGKIVDELLAHGIFEEVATPDGSQRGPHSSARLGRPARMLRLNSSKPRFLGVQLGVTQTSLAPLAVGGGGEDDWPIHFATPGSAEDWLRALRKATAAVPQKSFWGTLVSVPGLVDEQKAHVLYSPNLHWTEKVNLASLIRSASHNRVILVQEERALALGHHAIDSTAEDFLLVDFGEGVGGAVMVGGMLYPQTVPIGGEIGHTPVLGNARHCGCGAVGCLETLVSTRGLLKSFATASAKGRHTWQSLIDSISRHGLPAWLADALDAAGVVIAGALNVLGLRRVVITGTVFELPPAALARLSAAVSKGTLWARFGDVRVIGAPRRRTAGLVAAGIDRLLVPVSDS